MGGGKRKTQPVLPAVLDEGINFKEGVPLSALLFGSRRSQRVPLIREAISWSNGVYIGTTITKEIDGTVVSFQTASLSLYLKYYLAMNEVIFSALVNFFSGV